MYTAEKSKSLLGALKIIVFPNGFYWLPEKSQKEKEKLEVTSKTELSFHSSDANSTLKYI